MAKTKNTFKFSIKHIIAAIGLLAFLAIIGYYIGNDTGSEKATKNISPTNQTQETTNNDVDLIKPTTNIDNNTQKKESIRSEDLYDIQLPNGWIKLTENENNSETTVRYGDSDGNFLEVSINPGGRGFSSDETWIYEPINNEDNLKIVNKVTCEEQGAWCTKGDSKYTIGIKSSTENKEAYYIKNNHYFFFAGNDKRETNVDTAVFKNLVESIAFK